MKVDFENLSPQSKIWIYPADRILHDDDIITIRPQLQNFLENWSSHGSPILNFGDIYYNKFLVLFADETRSRASGCSIDYSVHFITELGNIIGVNFFQHLEIQYLDGKNLKTVSGTKNLKELINNLSIDGETLFFDNTIKDKHQFNTEWIKPIKNSWLKRFLNQNSKL